MCGVWSAVHACVCSSQVYDFRNTFISTSACKVTTVWSREKETYALGMARQRWGEGHLGTTCLPVSVRVREADRAEECATRLRHQPLRWLKQRVQSMLHVCWLYKRSLCLVIGHFSSSNGWQNLTGRSSNLGHRSHFSVVLWSILEVCLVGRWEVRCVSVFLLLGQDCWLEEWDRAVRWGVWLCPSVHSAGSCAFFSLCSVSDETLPREDSHGLIWKWGQVYDRSRVTRRM